MPFPVALSTSLSETKNRLSNWIYERNQETCDKWKFVYSTQKKEFYGLVSSVALMILAHSVALLTFPVALDIHKIESLFGSIRGLSFIPMLYNTAGMLGVTSDVLVYYFLGKCETHSSKMRTIFNLCAKGLQLEDIPQELHLLEGSNFLRYLNIKIRAVNTLLSNTTTTGNGQQQLKRLGKMLSQIKKTQCDDPWFYSLLPADWVLKKVIHQLRKSIDQCAIGQSVYIYGGSSDHAVIYRVWRGKKGYYFCIYNAGGGTADSIYHFHPSGSHLKITTDEILYPIYARAQIRVQNKEDIQDEKFLKLLLDKNQTSMKDVYLKIEQHFIAKNAHVARKTKRDFHRLQTIGSCAVTNLQIASHDVITDKNVRRALKLQEILSLVKELGGQKALEQQCPALWAIVKNKIAILQEKLQNKEKYAAQPVKDILDRAISSDALAPLPKSGCK